MAWFRESWRHAYARRGIKTGKYNGSIVARTRHGIPITLKEPAQPGKAYPLTPEQAKEALDKMPDKAISGIEEVNFRDPGIPATKQDKAWAQYVRTKKRINIFSQPYSHGRFHDSECGGTKKEVAEHMKSYVIPHEVGHHRAAKVDPKLPIIVEEAKADAFAARENPENQIVVERHINDRIATYGSKGTI
jgi:hypothetical protein